MKERISVIVVVLLFLSAAMAGLAYQKIEDDKNSSDTSIRFGPETARAGELVEFWVETSGSGGRVILPDNVFLVIKDRLSCDTELSFSGSSASFQALLPHSLTELEVLVESSGESRSFMVALEASSTPLLSGLDYYDLERHIVDHYPGRVTGSDNFQDAIQHFDAMFQEFGFETELQQFKRSDETGEYDVWNLVAYQWGARYRDEWIVAGAHLDIVDQTYQGAYDNGAGSAAIMEIAEAVGQLETDRTVVMVLWGGEEQGLWGSQHFVENLPDEVTVKTYLNYDMPGINWPGRSEYHGYIGPDLDDTAIEHPELLGLLQQTVFEVLGYPDEAFISQEQEVGSGDHDSFMDVGIPSVFFFGMTFESWTTNYHTPTDTIEGMELHAGGHDALVGGFNTVAWVGYYIIILLDNDHSI